MKYLILLTLVSCAPGKKIIYAPNDPNRFGGRVITTILHEVHTLEDHIIYDDIRERVAHISPELLEVLDSLQAKKAAA